MKRHLTLALFFLMALFIPKDGIAQYYERAVGARLGYPLSASYKHFLNDSNALEFYLGTRGFTLYRWFSVSGAYLVHKPIEDINGLRYYFGGGATVYFWNFDNDFIGDNSNTSIGLQGYIGLDYAFEDVPINLTVDWIPTIFINSVLSSFGGGYGTIGVRYILEN
ncbi:MAG: hypothetical protein AAFP19_00690 [Bacteroidota bacterium]